MCQAATDPFDCRGGGEGTFDRLDQRTIPGGARFGLRFDVCRLSDRMRVASGGANVYESGWRGDVAHAGSPARAAGIVGPGAGEARSVRQGHLDDVPVTVAGADPDTKRGDSVRCRVP